MKIKFNSRYSFFVSAVLVTFFLGIFLQKDYNFENGVFKRYTLSIVKDFDFNIFNQYERDYDKWMATESYNHPDFHHETLTPILSLGYLWHYVAQDEVFLTRGSSDFVIDSFLFILFLLFSLRLVFLSMANIFDRITDPGKIFVAVFFGTQLLVNYLFTPSEVAVFVMFGASMLLYISSKIEKGIELTLREVFAAGFCSSLKPELFPFLMLFPLHLLVSNPKPKTIKKVVVFYIPIVFAILNWKTRFGSLTSFSNIIMVKESNWLYSCILGREGLISLSPIYILGVIGGFVALVMTYKGARVSFSIVSQLLCLILISAGLSFTPLMEMPNSFERHIIPFLPLLIISIIYLLNFSESKLRIGKNVMMATVFGLSFLGFIFKMDKSFLDVRPEVRNEQLFSEFISHLQFLFDRFAFTLRTSYLQMILFAIILGVLCLAVTKVRESLVNLAFTLGLMFVFMSTLNAIYNPINSKKLYLQGAFKESVICKNELCFYDDVIDVFDIGIQQHRNYHRYDLVDLIQTKKDNYLFNNIKNVIHDPIKFKDEILKGHPRKSFWHFEDDFKDKMNQRRSN